MFPVCDSAVWSVGPVQFIWGLAWSGWRDCTGFSFCLAVLWRVRYGWNGGGGGHFLLLSLVCCQFSWRFNVCGRIFVLYSSISFGEFVVFSCGFVFWKLLIFNNLLQVVSAQSELGGGPGTSAWADAAWASEGGPRDPHRAFGGWCDVSEERLRLPGGRGKEGRNFLCDLWLGQWDFPAEGWAGFCEQPAVFLLDSSLDWCDV